MTHTSAFSAMHLKAFFATAFKCARKVCAHLVGRTRVSFVFTLVYVGAVCARITRRTGFDAVVSAGRILTCLFRRAGAGSTNHRAFVDVLAWVRPYLSETILTFTTIAPKRVNTKLKNKCTHVKNETIKLLHWSPSRRTSWRVSYRPLRLRPPKAGPGQKFR